jgi:hypothetical protein
MGCWTAAGVEIPQPPSKGGAGAGASLSPPFEGGFRGISTSAEARHARLFGSAGSGDPPSPLNKGEPEPELVLVPLLKGDLGGSSPSPPP